MPIKKFLRDENLTQNLIKLDQDFKKNELVLEVVNFLEKDKKRPICTPFSK
jgi:UDP-N-acetylglucosamine acyltransferase